MCNVSNGALGCDRYVETVRQHCGVDFWLPSYVIKIRSPVLRTTDTAHCAISLISGNTNEILPSFQITNMFSLRERKT